MVPDLALLSPPRWEKEREAGGAEDVVEPWWRWAANEWLISTANESSSSPKSRMGTSSPNGTSRPNNESRWAPGLSYSGTTGRRIPSRTAVVAFRLPVPRSGEVVSPPAPPNGSGVVVTRRGAAVVPPPVVVEEERGGDFRLRLFVVFESGGRRRSLARALRSARRIRSPFWIAVRRTASPETERSASVMMSWSAAASSTTSSSSPKRCTTVSKLLCSNHRTRRSTSSSWKTGMRTSAS